MVAPFANRIQGRAETVKWIFGDDVDLIMAGKEAAPIQIFAEDGRVILTVEPKPGEKTRDLVLRLLNGEETGGLVDGN